MSAGRKARDAGGGTADSRFPILDSRTTGQFTLEELRSWGVRMGAALDAPAVVALEGDLGAGKTTLVQAMCKGLGVTQDVTSPTFALVNQYEGDRATVYHLDLYRLRGPDDLTNLGWDDIVNSDAIVFVEWPDRAGDRLPPDAARIALEHVPGDERCRRVTVA
ncbi:tRNA threonylcarbamoyladenosine biosynthesis protein TsaE [uncultured bacterium]|nr:tRNA threonylcarbamoyladenosine biosynthesis protein TsaE [uncultured bacterium]